MKKLSVIGFMLLILVTSCSSDDKPRPRTSIVGTWVIISFAEKGAELIGSDDCDTLVTFTADTVTIEAFYGNNCSDAYPAETTSYSLEDDIITGFGSEGYEYEITELSATTLEIQYYDEFENYTKVIIVMEKQ